MFLSLLLFKIRVLTITVTTERTKWISVAPRWSLYPCEMRTLGKWKKSDTSMGKDCLSQCQCRVLAAEH